MVVDDVRADPYAPRVDQGISWPAAWRFPFAVRLDIAALRAAAWAFAVSRIILLATTYLAMAYHPLVWGHGQPASRTFWDAWYQWDARWYVRVARAGYHWHDLHHWASVAFFPLYPLLILALVIVVPISAKLAAILIANALFFAALYALYRLVRRECGQSVAARSTLYIALFPTALFFFAGYSESPFLCCSVLAIAAMRGRRWAWAALWGAVAAATRSQGILLAVPFLAEWWAAYGPRRFALVDRDGVRRRLLFPGVRARHLAQVLWVALIAGGWGALALFMWARFARPLLFIEIQRAWHRTVAWPWVGPWLALRHISLARIASATSADNLISLLSVLVFGALIVLGWRRLPHSYSLYAGASLLLILINPAALDGYSQPLMSTSRLCLTIFPCFITLGILGRWEPLDRLVTTLGPALLALFTVIFLQGAWVA